MNKISFATLNCLSKSILNVSLIICFLFPSSSCNIQFVSFNLLSTFPFSHILLWSNQCDWVLRSNEGWSLLAIIIVADWQMHSCYLSYFVLLDIFNLWMLHGFYDILFIDTVRKKKVCYVRDWVKVYWKDHQNDIYLKFQLIHVFHHISY